MPDSFRKTAAAALPPAVRRRYARELEAAQRYEILIDSIAAAGALARRALAAACEAAAETLRRAARVLDDAAHQLALLR